MNFINAQSCGSCCGGGGGPMAGISALLQNVLSMLLGLLTGGLMGNLMGGGGQGQSPMLPSSPGFGNPGFGGGGGPAQGMAGASNQFLGGGGSGFGGAGGSNFGGAGSGGGSNFGGAESVGGGAPIPTGPVAPGVDGMLDKARSMLGLHEGRDRAAIQSVTGKSGINPSTTPWCAAFAMNMLKDHGVLDTTGLSNPNYCPTIKNWASGKGIYGGNGQYTPKAGDAILFDWEKDGTSDHIGIVEKIENGRVFTIEGNSSNSVKRNSYPLGDRRIDGYVVTGKKR